MTPQQTPNSPDPILDLLRPAMARTAGRKPRPPVPAAALTPPGGMETRPLPAGRRRTRWMVVLTGGTLGLFTVVSGTVGQAAKAGFSFSNAPERPAVQPVDFTSGQPATAEAPIFIPSTPVPPLRFDAPTFEATAPREMAVRTWPSFSDPFVYPPQLAFLNVAKRQAATVAPLVQTVADVTPRRAATPATRPVEMHADAPAKALALDGVAADGQLRMMVNKTQIIKTPIPVTRISVAQPSVADVSTLDEHTLLVTAKTPGSTQLIVWGQEQPTAPGRQPAERNSVVDVNVGFDLQIVQDQINNLFPGRQITVGSLNGSLVLRGAVPDLKTAEQVEAVAAPYGKVVNFLEVRGGQQVMLHVQFAEVSKQVGTELGVNFGVTDGRSFFGSNPGNIPGLGATSTGANANGSDLSIPAGTSPTNIFGRALIGDTAFVYFVQALRQNNLLRVLAQPNVVATSGQEASFLAGGEFPIPVPQPGAGGGTNITIEYKEFGVRLNFTPVVLGDGRIRLKLSPEVSDLDYTAAVVLAGTRVPGLRKRSLTTTVELNEGQTFAVAGLLDSNIVANRGAVPLLGDLPILGALFRSVRYQRRETELVVLITPSLVEAMDPDQVPPLPGVGQGVPDELDLFLGGNIEAKPERAPVVPADPNRPAATFEGRRGFQPAPAQATASAE